MSPIAFFISVTIKQYIAEATRSDDTAIGMLLPIEIS